MHEYLSVRSFSDISENTASKYKTETEVYASSILYDIAAKHTAKKFVLILYSTFIIFIICAVATIALVQNACNLTYTRL